MATTNHERVGKALDLLKVGLGRGDGGQQPRHRVERPIGVVAREGLLVRPLAAVVA